MMLDNVNKEFIKDMYRVFSMMFLILPLEDL